MTDNESMMLKDIYDKIAVTYKPVSHIDSNINRTGVTNGVPTVSKSYTAESDGILLVFCSTNYTNSFTETVKLNNVALSPKYRKTATGTCSSVYEIQIQKGDVVSLSMNATNAANYNINVCYFMLFIG